MLILKRTNTMSVDIWNYHHCLLIGAAVFFVTNNIAISIITAAVAGMVVFKLSDWVSPLLTNYFKIESVTLPALSSLSSIVVGVPVNTLLNKLPFINKVNFNMDSAKKYLGPFGEPMIIGLVLGFGIGALAQYDLSKIMAIGINMAAVMVILPRMTGLFVEGLKPISQSAKQMTARKFQGRTFLIGLDPSITFGDTAVIITSLLMVPITIGLAFILPYNRLLPFADLAAIPFRMTLLVALTNGNIFRTLILGTCVMSATLLAGTATAPVMNELARNSGLGLNIPPEGMVSSLTGTSLPVSYLLFQVFTGNLMITIPLFICIFGGLWIYIERRNSVAKRQLSA